MKKSILSYDNFRGGSAWFLLLLGIALYCCGYFWMPNDSIWKEVLVKIADVLVIGVIIGYLSNAAQFLGVFKQDLQDIIYGKEFIKNRNRFPRKCAQKNQSWKIRLTTKTSPRSNGCQRKTVLNH